LPISPVGKVQPADAVKKGVLIAVSCPVITSLLSCALVIEQKHRLKSVANIKIFVVFFMLYYIFIVL
jgi:hypothetical protein